MRETGEDRQGKTQHCLGEALSVDETDIHQVPSAKAQAGREVTHIRAYLGRLAKHTARGASPWLTRNS